MSPVRNKKKRLAQHEFDRKIKVWTIFTSLAVALISSATAIGIAIYSSHSTQPHLNHGPVRGDAVVYPAPTIEYKINPADQVDLNRLANQISPLIRQYYETTDISSKQELDRRLQALADAEASIMRKYDPDYVERWPPYYPTANDSRPLRPVRTSSPITIWLLLLIVPILVLSILLGRSIARAAIRSKYYADRAHEEP